MMVVLTNLLTSAMGSTEPGGLKNEPALIASIRTGDVYKNLNLDEFFEVDEKDNDEGYCETYKKTVKKIDLRYCQYPVGERSKAWRLEKCNHDKSSSHAQKIISKRA